jgi:predicted small secreted protein
MIRNLIIACLFVLLIFLNACNTITGTVEGTGRGIIKDGKTIHHYSTCIFTDTQCGDLDLKK